MRTRSFCKRCTCDMRPSARNSITASRRRSWTTLGRLAERRSTKSNLAHQIDFHYDHVSVAAQDTEGPIPLGADGGLIWFACGRVVVTVAQNMVGGRPEAMARVRERAEELGESVALAIIVREGLERPDEETREDIRRSFDEISPMLACNAIAILGTGFFAGFFISIISQTLSLTRQDGGSSQIHSSLDSAASWMHEQLDDPGITKEDVLDTLHVAVEQAPALRTG